METYEKPRMEIVDIQDEVIIETGEEEDYESYS